MIEKENQDAYTDENLAVEVESQADDSFLPFDFARSRQVLFDAESETLLLGPDADVQAVLEAQKMFGLRTIERVDEENFAERLRTVYANQTGSSAAVMEDIQDFVDLESAAEELEDADLLEDDDAPIIRLLNAVLAESLKEKASDIHVEPYEHEARIRFRLDGVLRTVLSPSVHIAPLLISRIKVMAKLDIAERRLPQDGRMSVLSLIHI